MSAWGPARAADYTALPLHAHALLADVPLHDVWQVELPGGGPDRTLDDVRELMTGPGLEKANPAVRGLFALRRALGTIFRWDESSRGNQVPALVARVPQDILDRSRVAPGSREGPFASVYALENEALSEVRNATVHAFSVMALSATADGYRAYLGIYVAPVGRITPLYMGLIDPFRRWIVYPSLLKRVRREWLRRFADTPA